MVYELSLCITVQKYLDSPSFTCLVKQFPFRFRHKLGKITGMGGAQLGTELCAWWWQVTLLEPHH